MQLVQGGSHPNTLVTRFIQLRNTYLWSTEEETAILAVPGRHVTCRAEFIQFLSCFGTTRLLPALKS